MTGPNPEEPPVSIIDWKETYKSVVRSGYSKGWAETSLSYLNRLDDFLKGMENVTTDKLVTFLSDIANTKSAGTRNRTQNALAPFFHWAVSTKRLRHNPLVDIKRVPEQKKSDIVYCTPEEREEIIQLAQQTGASDWLAVPIAFLAGLRREEIANLKWIDVRLSGGTVGVTKTKTNTPRSLSWKEAKLSSVLISNLIII